MRSSAPSVRVATRLASIRPNAPQTSLDASVVLYIDPKTARSLFELFLSIFFPYKNYNFSDLSIPPSKPSTLRFLIMSKLSTVFGAAALCAVSLAANAGEHCASKPIAQLSGKTIVDVAAGDANFSTLVSLLTSANLVSTLQGPGPFTVFAPTNAAFAKVPSTVLGAIGSDPSLLSAVLTYHVAAGKDDLRHADDIKAITTVQGEKVFARAKCSKNKTLTLTVNNSTVTVAPIAVDNGIIYVVDSVLLPQF